LALVENPNYTCQVFMSAGACHLHHTIMRALPQPSPLLMVLLAAAVAHDAPDAPDVGKSANTLMLYGWARPRTVVIG
jgi:hypothetical protein